MAVIKYKATNLFKYDVAETVKNTMLTGTANTYVGIGRPVRWGDDSTELSSEIGDVSTTTNYINQAKRDMMAIKKIQSADIALVVPRLDWATNIVYDKYNDHYEMFSHLEKTNIAMVTANATMNLDGTVNVAAGSTIVYGKDTYFLGNVNAEDTIVVNSQSRIVESVPNNTTLTVASNFSYDGNGNTLALSVSSRRVRNGAGYFVSNIDVGDIIDVGNEQREVVRRLSDYTLEVNTKFNYAYTSNTALIRITDKYPLYANNFYVRNSRDQVFKCLDNANNTVSTVEPTIDIDGQLPENPFIETGDGYRWKYIYTIPYGLKQKFFTTEWMPVVSDSVATDSAVDGRIDIVDIISGGSDYYSKEGRDGSIDSYAILTVTGDGTGANLTAKVTDGIITVVNILDGGSGYTKAEVTAVDPYQNTGGSIATFDVVIGPPGGHGSNPAKELGCYSVMVSVELNSDENGKIPVTGVSGDFDFRQVLTIRDPLLANGEFATGEAYRTTTKFSLSNPAGGLDFENDEQVYIGVSYETAVFTATVAHWDSNTNDLYVIDMDGDYANTVGLEIVGNTTTTRGAILSIEESEILTFSGDTLYIENRLPIVRNTDQTEQIRLVYSF